MKTCRSRLSAIACRGSRLSKAGVFGLINIVRLTFVAVISQIACGACTAENRH